MQGILSRLVDSMRGKTPRIRLTTFSHLADVNPLPLPPCVHFAFMRYCGLHTLINRLMCTIARRIVRGFNATSSAQLKHYLNYRQQAHAAPWWPAKLVRHIIPQLSALFARTCDTSPICIFQIGADRAFHVDAVIIYIPVWRSTRVMSPVKEFRQSEI
jgi:hypothetical protein